METKLSMPIDRRVGIKTFTATIAAGANVSNVVDMQGYALVGIELATGITFDGDRFRFNVGMDVNCAYPLVDSAANNLVAFAATGDHIALDGDLFNSFQFVQLLEYRAGSTQINTLAIDVTLIGRSKA